MAERHHTKRVLLRAAASMGLAFGLGVAAGTADDVYPSRPIRLIVPFAPGGSADSLARIIGPELSSRLGQPVIVDNKAGAGGNIGIDAVAKSAADGYTLALASPGPIVVNATLTEGLPYDPVKDLAPVALIADLPIVLVVSNNLQVTDVPGLIAADKKAPGQLYYASAGVGTTMHLSGALFNLMAGTQLEHVPYKGAGAAITDILAGRVQVGFLDLPAAGSHVKAGAVKLLAVGNAKRATALPNIPTIAEAGVAGYETSGWFGVLAPARVSPAIVARLHTALAEVMAQPDVRDRLIQIGIEPTISTPAAFGQFIAAQIPKWAEVIKKVGATSK